MRLVATACVGLGVANLIGLVVHYLTATEAHSGELFYWMISLAIAQICIVLTGIALFRFHPAGWFAFWIVGPCAIFLAAKLDGWHSPRGVNLESVPFFILCDLALWFVPSAICLLLPSSRHCYFNVSDQLWMHQKVLRHGEQSFGDVSGRPRQPVGIAVLAWAAIVVAGGLFYSAVQNFATPEGFDPEETHGDAVALWKIFAMTVILLAATGLMKKKVWGWFAMFSCAVLGIPLVGALKHYGTTKGFASQFHVTPEWFFMCVVWCGFAILYLLLPATRHAFFSRRRSRRRAPSERPMEGQGGGG